MQCRVHCRARKSRSSSPGETDPASMTDIPAWSSRNRRILLVEAVRIRPCRELRYLTIVGIPGHDKADHIPDFHGHQVYRSTHFNMAQQLRDAAEMVKPGEIVRVSALGIQLGPGGAKDRLRTSGLSGPSGFGQPFCRQIFSTPVLRTDWFLARAAQNFDARAREEELRRPCPAARVFYCSTNLNQFGQRRRFGQDSPCRTIPSMKFDHSEINARASSRVLATATQPGRSGTVAPTLDGPCSKTTAYFIGHYPPASLYPLECPQWRFLGRMGRKVMDRISERLH